MKTLCGTILAAGLAVLSAHGAFDVRDFGAKGDGVTDDTAAFQAAIDAVAAQGAGKIVIPYSPKGYRIAGPGRFDIKANKTNPAHSGVWVDAVEIARAHF